eukprot:Em0010g403a
MIRLAVLLFVCLPAFAIAGLALPEPSNEAEQLALLPAEDDDREPVQVLLSAQQNEISWVFAKNGFVPANSVSGGTENDGEPQYVASMEVQGGRQVPGRLVVSRNRATTSFNGITYLRDTYLVLTNPSRLTMSWQPFVGTTTPPANAISGGSDGLHLVYVARVRRPDGMMFLGWASYHRRLCTAVFNNREETYFTGCDVLTRP